MVRLHDYKTGRLGRRYATIPVSQRFPQMLGPSHPETNARCTAMMIRPCEYLVNIVLRSGDAPLCKTRDSTRPALQKTAFIFSFS